MVPIEAFRNPKSWRLELELNLKIEFVGEIRNRVAHSEQDAANGFPLGSPFSVGELVVGDGTKPVRLIVERPGVSEVLNLTEALNS